MRTIVGIVAEVVSFALVLFWLYCVLAGIGHLLYRLTNIGQYGVEKYRPMGIFIWFIGTWVILPLLLIGIDFVG
jgi:succinate dehydrogenase/fumarate reductase cytochrome b subunit